MRRRTWMTLALVVGLAPAGAAHAGEIPRGRVLAEVLCEADPELSYALYLPSGYDPEAEWPVIFAFSPGARGITPVKLLEAAAEKYGYIVAGSNDSRNGPMEPILRARAAMLKDVNARFAVDPKRSYATGFSGGARVALDMALTHRDRFAGVISCGAFYAGGRPLPETSHLVFFGLVGETCFNNPELERADADLGERGWLHWIEEFDGAHTWPPADLMAEAVEFLELAVRRDESGPVDMVDPVAAAFEADLAKARIASAASLAEKGKKLLALRKYRQTAELFPDTETAKTAAARVAALEADPDVRAAREQQAELVALAGKLRDLGEREAFQVAAQRLREIAGGEGALAGRAQMLLQMAYMGLTRGGQSALQKEDFDAAIRYLSATLELVPDDWRAAYNLACAWALKGDKAKAVELLKVAVENGFDDVAHLREDTDLDGIREEPGYLEVVKELEGE